MVKETGTPGKYHCRILSHFQLILISHIKRQPLMPQLGT